MSHVSEASVAHLYKQNLGSHHRGVREGIYYWTWTWFLFIFLFVFDKFGEILGEQNLDKSGSY